MVPLYFSAPKTNWGPQIQDDFIYVSPERPLKGYNAHELFTLFVFACI
jgi:hypothetical protein